MYCTQCEAEGFRRVTLFQDRPDVMARCLSTVMSLERLSCLWRIGRLMPTRMSQTITGVALRNCRNCPFALSLLRQYQHFLLAHLSGQIQLFANPAHRVERPATRRKTCNPSVL